LIGGGQQNILETILFSFNAVAPITLLTAAGYLLRRSGFFNEEFSKKACVFALNYCLPFTLFFQVYRLQQGKSINPNLMLFTFIAIIAVAVILFLIVPLFIRDRRRAASFIACGQYGNYGSIGLPIIVNLFGAAAAGPMVLLVPIVGGFQTICTLVAFAVLPPDEKRRLRLWDIIKPVLSSTLLWGIAAGVLIRAVDLRLPVFLENTIFHIGNIAVPLALISLGAQINLKNILSDIRFILAVCFVRLIAVPMLVLPPALWLGFNQYEIGALLVAFGSSVGVVVYSFALKADSDHKFCTGAILLSLVLSSLTLFLWILFFRLAGVF